MSDIVLLFIIVFATISGAYLYVLIATLGPALERVQRTSNLARPTQTVAVVTVRTVEYVLIETTQPESAYTGKTISLGSEVR